VACAIEKHVDAGGSPHVRKGSDVPYLSHLLAVTALVWEAGGDEDQAIAAMLHDTLEDTRTTAAELQARFGPEVARLVEACSDGLDVEGERDATTWVARKQGYLGHLADVEPRAMVISTADKLHNAMSIVAALEEADLAGNSAATVWGRFNAPSDQIIWYYREILAAINPTLGQSSLYRRLSDTVDQMTSLVPPPQR
jgi:(p)ppGpp synthase/HD superfamily hydrolase